MKIRTGFVSNSSASSFVTSKDIGDKDDVIRAIINMCADAGYDRKEYKNIINNEVSVIKICDKDTAEETKKEFGEDSKYWGYRDEDFAIGNTWILGSDNAIPYDIMDRIVESFDCHRYVFHMG